jgi:hypothetical protein
MTCLFSHRWSRPWSEGRRDRTGRWISSGAQYQLCLDCGARRESPIQFAESAMAKTLREIEQDMAEFKWEKV